MIIPTTDNITKSHTFTAQNWLRRACHVMCLLLVLPLIACGSGGTGSGGTDGTGPGDTDTDDAVDQTFVAYLEKGDLTLNNFLKTDTGKAVGEDDHLRGDLGAQYRLGGITDLAIEAGTEANTIKITVKEITTANGAKSQRMGLVETLSYTDPDPIDDGRFLLKKEADEWGLGLFSSTSNSGGSTVMGLVSKERLKALPGQPEIDHVLVVTGKEYVWNDIAKQNGLYTFGGPGMATSVGYKITKEGLRERNNGVWFEMTLDIPTTEQTKTKNLPVGADAILSITNWSLNADVNASAQNFLPLPSAVSLKGGVGGNNLRFVKGDAVNYIDEHFLNFGTYKDYTDRQAGNRNGRRFNESKAKTDFYKKVNYSSITARLYGEPDSLAKNKAVIAGTYFVDTYNINNAYPFIINWGVYVLKQQ